MKRLLIILLFLLWVSALIMSGQIVKQLPANQRVNSNIDVTGRANAQALRDSASVLNLRYLEQFTELDEKLNEIKGINAATDDAIFRYLLGVGNDTVVPPPPPPADTIETLFQLDFQNTSLGEYNLTEWRRDWNNPAWANHALGYGYIVDESGNRAMRVSFPANTFGLAQHGLQWNTYFAPMNQGYMDIWFQYRLKFSAGFNGVLKNDGKLPGLAANNLVSGGITGQQLIDGLNGLSARYMFNSGASDLRFYLYYSDLNKAFGDATPIPTKTYYGASVLFSNEPGPNVWFTITQRVRLNTLGQSDGFVEGYINGVRRAYQGGLKWRTAENIKLNFITIALFLGGSGVATQTQEYIYLDDFIVYRKL